MIEIIKKYSFYCLASFNSCLELYPMAFPLLIIVLGAFMVLIICKMRTSSAKSITAGIKKEIKNKVDDVKDFVGVGTRPRFRKRDKIYFYGQKMLRKVKANIPTRPVPSRQFAKKLASKLLGQSEKESPHLKVFEPPMEYMQEDISFEGPLPSEFLIMLKNIRVFGHFDMPLFLELCKSLKTIRLSKGDFLFQIGDCDDSIFIVQTGRLRVSIMEEGITHDLKEVTTGESIISLLSFCDVLTGRVQPYKTVCAKAVENSVIMVFPVKAFEEIFDSHPHMYIRVVQIVMARLMRVTFLALHHYLGLSSELMRKYNKKGTAGNLLSSPGKTKRDGVPIHELDHHDDYYYNIDHTGSYENKSELMLDRDRRQSESERDRRTEIMLDRDRRQSELGESARKHPEQVERKQSFRKITLFDPKMTEKNTQLLATEKIKSLLHLDSTDLLEGRVTVRHVKENEFLMKQDSTQDCGLFYILSGSLIVSQSMPESSHDVQLFTACPGDLVGGLAVLSGDPSFFNVKAKHHTTVAIISKDTIYAIIKETPRVVLHIARTVLLRMSPFVRQIDFALDWEHLQAGRALYKQGQICDSTFIILSGRLRSVITHENGRKEVVGEYGKGDLVGIVELLTQTERSTTVMAVRDSELAKLPEGLFNVIKLKHPIVMTRLIKLLGQRILGTWKSSPKNSLGLKVDQRPTQSNFSTVAIVPISEDVLLSNFTLELYHSMLAIGPATRLTSEYVVKSLGTSIWENANEYQLISWLGQIEDCNRVTLYQCDSSLTVWTQRCIRQADVIINVGLAKNEPSVGKIEKHVEAMAIRTQKILVLLHNEGSSNPSGTVKWLNMRSWCHSHHHIIAPKRVFMKKTPNKILEYYTEKVFIHEPIIHTDFSRLARILTGTSIGLVLGGGGARGAAHIGIIKAIQEAGIPIDMVAGVSIGAFLGALFCKEKDLTSTTQKAREWSMKMTNKWRMAMDLTYPIVSMFSGAGFNKLLLEVLGESTCIEDLWLPYFTLTTDIIDSCARTHTHGSAWRYVRASMSLSGYMPPVCDPLDGHLLLDGGYVNNLPGLVWKYVRASMSLVMLVPPMPDPQDGHLLVDGCYVNNVPADVMRSKWNVGTILAIDVGSTYDTGFTNYGDALSGWSLLLRRIFPFKYFYSNELKVPNLYDIQSRLSYVSCTRQLEELKNSDFCEYIRPPIDKYLTLQFGLFDEIREVGYEHGKSYFNDRMKNGLSAERIYNLKYDAHTNPVDALQHKLNLHSRPGTFTDLAEIVCSVKAPEFDYVSETSSEEYVQSGYASEPNTCSAFFNEDLDNLTRLRRARTGSLSDHGMNLGQSIDTDSEDSRTTTTQDEIEESAEIDELVEDSVRDIFPSIT